MRKSRATSNLIYRIFSCPLRCPLTVSLIYALRFRLYTSESANSNQTDFMYQPVTLFIGLRYMRGRAADRFGRFVSWLSTIGITLGVMALVTVLSVMNGFERELQNNILGLMPQAVITAQNGSINPEQLPANGLKLQGVNRIAPLSTGDVVLQSARSVAVGVMLGIDPSQKDPLTPYLVNVQQSSLEAGQYNVILGEGLAGQLGVNRGDQIRVMVPSASQFTPMGRLPSQRLFYRCRDLCRQQ